MGAFVGIGAIKNTFEGGRLFREGGRLLEGGR